MLHQLLPLYPKHQPYVPLPFSAHSNVSTSLLPFCHSAIRPVAPSLLHSCLLWAAQALFPGNATPKSPKVQQLHLSRSTAKTLIENLYELLWSPMKSYEVCVLWPMFPTAKPRLGSQRLPKSGQESLGFCQICFGLCFLGLCLTNIWRKKVPSECSEKRHVT